MKRFVFLALIVAFVAVPAMAQTTTGTLSGRVTDGTDALPGVTVTALSPNLQGSRVAVTTANGDYIFSFLPPGEYTAKFELSGFQTVEAAVKISGGQSARVDAEMTAQLTEEILVTGSYETISSTNTASTTITQDVVELLPVPRDLYNAVALAPGVHTTGPSGNLTISGSHSYESLYLINGVVTNENMRGQSTNLFIEDAIQETTTSVSGISAEYGRFAGGVVNMLTKSGGNDFHGSLRLNLDSDKWTAPTPKTTAERSSTVNKTWEATLGGFAMRDHIWFFLAGRDRDTTGTDQTHLTNHAFDTGLTETRYEGKLTLSPSPNHRLVGSYIERERVWGGYYFGSLPIMDLASVYDRSIPEDMYSINYTGILTENFFVEAQYSTRHLTFVDSGNRFTDMTRGTVLYDNSNGWVGAAAIFCGVCEEETRDNEDLLVKGSWFLSSAGAGSHDIIFGYDQFKDQHLSMNHQSGSDWFISATEFVVDGSSWYPVFYPDWSADIDWYPILEQSKGSEFIVNSYFVNDKWRLNDKLSFNIGFRYDANDGTNATGDKVSKDSRISPRLGMTYDLRGDGNWILNASYSNYVTSLANSGNVSDKSPGGNPATFIWLYEGPEINTGGVMEYDPYEAIDLVFDWFNNDYCDADGNCGINNFDLLAGVGVPGKNRVIKGSLASPYAEELTIGVTKRLGSKGVARMDFTHREYKDLYTYQLDTTTGTVDLVALGVNWGTVDLGYVKNSSYLDRKYDGFTLQANYRLSDRWTLGGNYTWSQAIGNWDGETSGSGPISSSNNPEYYPEYRDVAWGNPSGWLNIDQRHKAQAYVLWDIFHTRYNRLSASLLQGYYSGQPYDAVGAVRSYYYVTNPGYRNRPSSVTYFYSDRGAYRTDDITRTDIALNYSFTFPAMGADIEFFVQPEVQNVFNEHGVTGVNTTVYDYTNYSSKYARFDPFTEKPVEGVNWDKGPNFGKPTSPGNYQNPRTFRVSFGIRF